MWRDIHPGAVTDAQWRETANRAFCRVRGNQLLDATNRMWRSLLEGVPGVLGPVEALRELPAWSSAAADWSPAGLSSGLLPVVPARKRVLTREPVVERSPVVESEEWEVPRIPFHGDEITLRHDPVLSAVVSALALSSEAALYFQPMEAVCSVRAAMLVTPCPYRHSLPAGPTW